MRNMVINMNMQCLNSYQYIYIDSNKHEQALSVNVSRIIAINDAITDKESTKIYK